MASSNILNDVIGGDKSANHLDPASDTFVIWLWSFGSVVLISFCGLVPIVCMPRLQRSRYQNDLLQFLIGLAIGTLTADALLHLLPISSQKYAHKGHHHHAEDDHHNHHHNDTTGGSTNATKHDDGGGDAHGHLHDSDGFWFGFMALVGIIGFLVIERIMNLLTDVFTHKEHSIASSKSDSEHKNNSVQMSESHQHPNHHDHQNHHQHQHHHLTSDTKSFMFMIITGDGLHNFFDGVAIAVAFSSSVTVGLGTSIAILCHELPHEIGDFAVLIRAGMTIKKAVLYNILSSILCLLGATFGVFIGRIDVGWVSALTAGSFLYISLVDMVPQLDCYPTQPAVTRAKKLVIQLVGISAGIAIMSLIAIYESALHSMISNHTGANKHL
ncbi:uncharacterized protein LOC143868818 [Tasmannia lanceolata]|uniref:uncharacterized protein LOC143868818 n=1 Tax=Tasmannia lanceolata TaxID=3420 RepID=UPI0040642F71